MTRGNPTDDGRARICEFEVHGEEGWQFTNDAEGWTPRIGHLVSRVQRQKAGSLEFLAAEPTIESRDNLNIPTSKFAALRVRMRNSGAQTSAKLSFTSAGGSSIQRGQERHRQRRAELSGVLRLLLRPLSDTGRSGILRQLRLTPIAAIGDVSIDSIALEETNPHSRSLVPLEGSPQKPRVVPR